MSAGSSGANGAELHRAADPARDQSYFLFATTREQLDYLRFPLGGLPKPAVRELARELGLLVADKPDSQDICFVPDGDYAAVVEEGAARGGAAGRDRRPGRAACSARHRGLIHFTVGQRRGLEIGGQAEPLYVVRLEPEARRVVVGPKAALAVRAARLSEPQLARRGPERRPDRQGPLAGAARRRRAFDGETRALRRARIWRRAGPGGGALRRRPGARRRLDRGDDRFARESLGRRVEDVPRRDEDSSIRQLSSRLRARPGADRDGGDDHHADGRRRRRAGAQVVIGAGVPAPGRRPARTAMLIE